MRNRRLRRGRVEAFSSRHHHGQIEGVTAANQKAFLPRIATAKSETLLQPSRSLSESALSWPNGRHHGSQLEGFSAPHRHGGIGDFADRVEAFLSRHHYGRMKGVTAAE